MQKAPEAVINTLSITQHQPNHTAFIFMDIQINPNRQHNHQGVRMLHNSGSRVIFCYFWRI